MYGWHMTSARLTYVATCARRALTLCEHFTRSPTPTETAGHARVEFRKLWIARIDGITCNRPTAGT